MKIRLKLIYAVLAVGILATSCSKEDVVDASAETFDTQESWAALEQEVFTVETWEDSEDELANGRITNDDEHLFTPDCVTKTWRIDSANHARILTIDFGETFCLGRDGLYRKGIIQITFIGPRRHLGSTKSTEFIGYQVMDHEFNGTKHVEFLGNHMYSREVDMTLTVGPGVSSWYADQLVEMIAGYQTEIKHDDLFQVTGNGGGIKRNGVGYTAIITEQLLRKLQPGCYQNFVDGVIEFTNDNAQITLLDYDPLGGAPCDKLAAITRNGNTHFITLW